MHKIASRIKAAKAQNLLESDFDYISLVYQLLPESQKEKWVNYASSNPTWDSFYKFLEDVYEKALLKKQINDSCKQNSGKDKITCTNCNKPGHTADRCYSRNVLTATVGVNACPVCEASLHTNNGNNNVSRKVLSCPNYKSADDEAKRQIFSKVKSKLHKICQLCTG